MNDAKQQKSNYRLIIFDWDGTLADSLQHIVRSVRFAANKLGFPNKSDEEIKDIIGLGLAEAMQSLFPEIDVEQRDEMTEHYRSYYLATTGDGIDLYPDVEETIKLLHEDGYDLAVATGKSRRGLDRALSESGLGEYFHYSRCADETFSKPHPQMLEDIIAYSAATKEEVLMIGDTEHDLQMANNAGVCSAAVTYGAQNSDYLLKFKPATFFDNLRQLRPWLSKNML
jgi:phosphoglycolate phosphatase